MRLLITSILLAFSCSSLAYNCDCTKIVGRCSGNIILSKTSGSIGNYSGEITIKSSVPFCSKVDYYVNNTPYSTTLNNNNQDTESIFSTNPIKKSDISFKSCYVCFRKDGDNSPSNNNEIKKNNFIGVWSGTLSWLFISDKTIVTITKKNGILSGTWTNKSSTATLSSVNTTDTSMSVVFTGRDNAIYTYVFNLITPTSASVKYANGGMVSFSGTMHKTP